MRVFTLSNPKDETVLPVLAGTRAACSLEEGMIFLNVGFHYRRKQTRNDQYDHVLSLLLERC